MFTSTKHVSNELKSKFAPPHSAQIWLISSRGHSWCQEATRWHLSIAVLWGAKLSPGGTCKCVSSAGHFFLGWMSRISVIIFLVLVILCSIQSQSHLVSFAKHPQVSSFQSLSLRGFTCLVFQFSVLLCRFSVSSLSPRLFMFTFVCWRSCH